MHLAKQQRARRYWLGQNEEVTTMITSVLATLVVIIILAYGRRISALERELDALRQAQADKPVTPKQ